MGPWFRRSLAATLALGWLAVAVAGVYGYWQSYYVHRGFAPVRAVPHSGHGHKHVVLFYSPALHREFDYRVLLPPRYDPAHHRYPVFYLLHGSPGRPQAYEVIADIGVRLDNLIAQHEARPMILVFPDGRIGGDTYSDSEWANTPAGAYERYVLDVVRDVDRRFATVPGRRHRVIAGFSAGAYGALNIALHELPVFGAVQVWSGYFAQQRTGVFAHADRATLAYDSPLAYARGLAPRIHRFPLNAYMFVGRGDHARRQIRAMFRELAADGADVAYHIYAGGHDWQLWNAHVNGMLVRASRAIGAPPRAPHGAAGPPPPGRRRHHHPHHRRARRHHHATTGPRRTPPPGGVRRASARRALVSAARARPGPGPPSAGAWRPGAHRPDRLGTPLLLAGLLLALGSAALINLGFLLQHHGLRAQPDPSVRGALRNRAWLTGQALGWLGFAAQVVAVAIAPLSLVQAFVAGGLALSMPLAAGFFGHRVSRRQLVAVLLIAAGLATLPIATTAVHDRLADGRLIVLALLAFPAAIAIALVRRGPGRAIAAGIFYGTADAAIKAVSVGWRAHGISALWSGWTALAVIGTFAGFLAFQAALRGGGGVSSISMMTAFAALVALACGVLAFGESLGRDGVAVAAHLGAIAVVLACVPSLAAAETEIAAAQAGLAARAEGAAAGERDRAAAARPATG